MESAQGDTVISLQEAQAPLAATELASKDGFISINADNVIVLTSPLLEKMWGYELGELLGKTVQTLIPPRYLEHHTAGVQRFVEEDKKATTLDWAAVEALRKDSTGFPIHIRIVRALQPRRFLLVAAVRSAVPYDQARNAVEDALKLAEGLAIVN